MLICRTFWRKLAVVRWERVNGYLKEFGFIPTSGDDVGKDKSGGFSYAPNSVVGQKLPLDLYIVCVVLLYTREGAKIVNDKVLNMRIPERLYNELKKAAQDKNISLAAFVRLICSEYLQKQK